MKYKYIEKMFFPKKPDSLINYLNDLGDDGWQVVSIIPSMFIDKPTLVCRYDIVLMRLKNIAN